MDDPRAGVAEMVRVVHPGGVVAACTWDFAGGMQLLRAFWEAARAVNPEAASETTFGTLEELDELWNAHALEEIELGPLEVSTPYADFDELWSSFQLGVGLPGSTCPRWSRRRKKPSARSTAADSASPPGASS